jgi:hypothetical protein
MAALIIGHPPFVGGLNHNNPGCHYLLLLPSIIVGQLYQGGFDCK